MTDKVVALYPPQTAAEIMADDLRVLKILTETMVFVNQVAHRLKKHRMHHAATQVYMATSVLADAHESVSKYINDMVEKEKSGTAIPNDAANFHSNYAGGDPA